MDSGTRLASAPTARMLATSSDTAALSSGFMLSRKAPRSSRPGIEMLELSSSPVMDSSWSGLSWLDDCRWRKIQSRTTRTWLSSNCTKASSGSVTVITIHTTMKDV